MSLLLQDGLLQCILCGAAFKRSPEIPAGVNCCHKSADWEREGRVCDVCAQAVALIASLFLGPIQSASNNC